MNLKMHIVLRPDISVETAMIAVAHASIGTYLTFKDDDVTKIWENNSFKKVIHKSINLHQFKSCRELGPHRVFIESSMGNSAMSVGFKPMLKEHPWFDDIPLWKFKWPEIRFPEAFAEPPPTEYANGWNRALERCKEAFRVAKLDDIYKIITKELGNKYFTNMNKVDTTDDPKKEPSEVNKIDVAQFVDL